MNRLTAGLIIPVMLLAESQLTAATPGRVEAGSPVVEYRSAKCSTRHCRQWGGTPRRNNTPRGYGIPIHWDPESGDNILWSAQLGTQTNSTPVVADGRVYIGTNNGNGYLGRYPASVDLGCLLCFDSGVGEFLWQYSAEKLPGGPRHDFPEMGICGSPRVTGDRLWFVSNRGELVCLDTEGFRDGENDGPFQRELVVSNDEADVVWSLDLMGELGVRPHNMANCSVTGRNGVIFVSTSNGVDKSHENVPAPHAPSFLAVDERTGAVLWSDNSPGANILHGQWSSPAFAVLRGRPQVIFAGGDGWLYSFNARGNGSGGPRLLWRFDCNHKESVWRKSGRGTRNNIIATPVIHDGLVYVATGLDPEKPLGSGDLWCIDPGHLMEGNDVSPELAMDAAGYRIPPRRVQAVDVSEGERAIPNPESALVWHYDGCDFNGDGHRRTHECLQRTLCSVAIQDDLLILPDLAGVVHCLDARTGRCQWTCDLLDGVWASPLIVDGKIYVGTDSGRVAVFRLHADPAVAMHNGAPSAIVDMGDAIHATPVVADNVLYIATSRRLYAIGLRHPGSSSAYQRRPASLPVE